MSHRVEAARWLASDTGLEAVARVAAELDTGEGELGVGARLRVGLDAERAALVMEAAHARRRARERWADADELLFTREGLEQASDPEASAWRARRLGDDDGRSGDSPEVWDLGAGIGGDTLALAAAASRPVTAVDRDGARLALLAHNARVRGVEVRAVEGDVLGAATPAGAWLHTDPGRRAGTRRLRRLGELLPPVPALLAAHPDAGSWSLVLSPAVDLADPDLPDGELELVQIGTNLVEAVVWRGETRREGIDASATLLPDGRHRARRGPPVVLDVGEVGAHVVEVAPAAVRARLHNEIGAEIGARRIASRRALLTLDDRPPTSPWYVSRRVEAVLPPREKAVRAWLRTVEPLPIELAAHGMDLDAQRWWRALGSPPRGPAGRRIELVRRDADAVALVTRNEPGDAGIPGSA